jgi:benzoyl-CoA reductase/2-hydroxyglutaryl-CoA dehydratase subunit BcrC/BadD/HgdB
MNKRVKIQLDSYLQNRPAQIQKLKEKGIKVIGYFPGDYVPEELIYASGAIPLCLSHGGTYEPAETALSVVPDVICPFARAQIGERLLKKNPYYSLIDMLIAPITCQHLRKVAEIWEYNGDLEIFKLGIPHQHDNDFELKYFANRLEELKNRLETFTGNKITDNKIGSAIELYNNMRLNLRGISLTRRFSQSSISALEFIKLNHASFYAEPNFMVDLLASIYRELTDRGEITVAENPRILLLGPNIGCGDYNLLELVNDVGGEIVAEDIFEGIRYYWRSIENQGDPIQSLARGYLIDRLPSAFMRYSAQKRLDFTLDLIKNFRVDGIIFYELLCCETYDSESYYFAREMAERHIPMLILESNYVTADTGQLSTRIQAFLEVIKNSKRSY